MNNIDTAKLPNRMPVVGSGIRAFDWYRSS